MWKGRRMDNEVRQRIATGIREVIGSMMDKVLNKVLVDDPFLPERHHAAKPLYAALVPDEIFKGSHFERRFVTPFGTVWERLAMVVAREAHGNCQKGMTIQGTIRSERLRRIQEVLNRLEHATRTERQRHRPNWGKELAYVLAGGGELIPCPVTCDLFIESTATGKRYAFELKAPLPNSDQTKVSKEKMLKLLAMTPQATDFAFYALVYNPYGRREDYAWSFPARWFDMKHDPSVLIGEEFWDLIGGEGTYRAFIDEVNKLGAGYKEAIYRDFLGIEPPQNAKGLTLK